MEGTYYLLGIFLILGFVQGDVISRNAQHAIIEDLRSASGSRIAGGWPASLGQIPFKISIRTVSGTGGVSACGGSVIHHQWILTAAHCLANRITFLVRLGLVDLLHPEYMLETNNKFIHPNYNEIQGGVQTHDIGLLGLDYYIPYSPTIQPGRMQNSASKNTNYSGLQLVVSGYGRTDDWWHGGVLSDVLLWTFLRGFSNEECLTWYPYSQVIKEETICAGYYNDTAQSSCMGDSGGPLTMVDYDGKPTIIGVVSFGHATGCRALHPAGFVRPGYYHDWFTEVTGMDFDWIQPEEELKPITLDFEDKVKVVDH